MKKCCFCLSLPNGVRSIGAFLFLLTLGFFICYLIFIESIRLHVLQNFYGIEPCSRNEIDIAIDSLFEYSLLVNVLLIVVCRGCTRWLLVPWLIMYAVNIIIFLVIAVLLFIFPLPLLPESRPEFPMLRCLGLVPLIMALGLIYCWIVVKTLFAEMSSSQEEEAVGLGTRDVPDPCCPMQLRTGIQIMGGILALISVVLLVVHYAKLDRIIADKYERIFGEPPSSVLQVVISSIIVKCILANVLVIIGGSGSRWRRSLLLPWLIIYGLLIMGAIAAHQWFTTRCWVEEKIYGLISLIAGFLGLIVWTLVWIVAAEASEKPKMLIARNPLGFQRL